MQTTITKTYFDAIVRKKKTKDGLYKAVAI